MDSSSRKTFNFMKKNEGAKVKKARSKIAKKFTSTKPLHPENTRHSYWEKHDIGI